MLLLLAAYLGGVLTIFSPCILPILPFTFARADRPFRKTGLPLLVGMAITFALLAGATAAGGPWLIRTNQLGRTIALILFSILGLTLLIPGLADRLSRPIVQLGNRLTAFSAVRSGIGPSILLGIATGLLWAPCAGPILGLILTGAAIQGITLRTSLLLFSYALGAATSLAVAMFAGARVFQYLKRFLGAERWLRPALGIAVLCAVFAVAFGFDRGFLTQLSTAGTSGFEQGILSALHATPPVSHKSDENQPSFKGATAWINSEPLQLDQLRGKVVLVDFWTYSCINCLRSSPYVEAWAKKYAPSGLVVVGVHTPEFAFEKEETNVRKAVLDLGIIYPVALDNDYGIWRSFANQYWPAHYFFDINGKLRYKHFGEGETEESEQWIRQLLAERHAEGALPVGTVTVHATGAQAASDESEVDSSETYVGYGRTENFASSGGLVRDRDRNYARPATLDLNEWALSGRWVVHRQDAVSIESGGRIHFRFHARDLHLVLGPQSVDKPVRYRVTIDRHAPGRDHGVDTNSQGEGSVTSQRLYQLIRQTGTIADRDFEIQFLDPGVQAFAFTFG